MIGVGPRSLPGAVVVKVLIPLGDAATINAQAPDALALQEVGDPDALDDLEGLLDGNWHRRVSSYPDARHIRVAWLARLAITEPDEIVKFPPGL
jgi:hypothetical protein